MSAKFKKLSEGYQQDQIETQRQLHLGQLDREENERLMQVFKT